MEVYPPYLLQKLQQADQPTIPKTTNRPLLAIQLTVTVSRVNREVTLPIFHTELPVNYINVHVIVKRIRQ